MNLIDESRNLNKSNNKIIIACGVAIGIIFIILIALIIYVVTASSNKLTLTVDNKKYTASNYLIKKDDVLYIGIEDLTKIMPSSGYSFKSGSKDVEDDNKCYVTNTYESTFFETGSSEIYKILEDTNEIEYYNIGNSIIKENGKIYIPIDSIKVAMNAKFSNINNKIIITSIGFLENYYNSEAKSFVKDPSILWETTYSNKKLLKNGMVITKDNLDQLGVAIVSASTDKKTKVTKVSTQSIITPKYKSIKYVEKYNQLIVENENGKGIVQLSEINGNITTETLIKPEFEDIKQINDNLFLYSKTINNDEKKYGIVKANEDSTSGEGKIILEAEYNQIGIDISKFSNNGLNNGFVLYNSLIPVKKDNLWGFMNTNGKLVINYQYTDIGCISGNTSNNVVIIPEINAIVVNKDNKYGIITKTNTVIRKTELSKVYKDVEDGKNKYIMIYNNKKEDVINYANNLNSKNNSNNNKTNNTTNTTGNNKTNNVNNNTSNKTNNTVKKQTNVTTNNTAKKQ